MTVVEAKPGRPANKALRAERRTDIVSAAAMLFAKHGYAGTDLNVLAKSVKLSKGTIYYYFQNKECLFLAAVDWMLGQLQDAMNLVLDSEQEPLQKIERGIIVYLEFCAQHPEFVELLIHERSAFPDREKPTYFAYKESNSQPWHDLYEGLIANGYVRQISVERIKNVICDLLYGIIFTNHFSGRKKDPLDQADDIMDVLFQGILTQKGIKKYKGQKHVTQ